jgi:hypothetical protein
MVEWINPGPENGDNPHLEYVMNLALVKKLASSTPEVEKEQVQAGLSA